MRVASDSGDSSGVGDGGSGDWCDSGQRKWRLVVALGNSWSRSGSGTGHGQWRASGKGVRVQLGLSGAVDMATPGLGTADGGGGSERQEAGRENNMNSKRLPLLFLL